MLHISWLPDLWVTQLKMESLNIFEHHLCGPELDLTSKNLVLNWL